MERENFNNPKRVSTYQPSNERKRRGGKKNGGNSRGGRRIEEEEKRRKVAAKETRKKEDRWVSLVDWNGRKPPCWKEVGYNSHPPLDG